VLLILGGAVLLAGFDYEMTNVKTFGEFASMAQDPEFFHLLGLSTLIGFTMLVITSINDRLDKITFHTTGSLARGSVFSLAGVFAAGFIAVKLVGYSNVTLT
jgi:hypothetical protein